MLRASIEGHGTWAAAADRAVTAIEAGRVYVSFDASCTNPSRRWQRQVKLSHEELVEDGWSG